MAAVEIKCAGCGKVARANVEWNAWKCLKCGHAQPAVRNLRPVSANYVDGHSKLGRKRQGNLYLTRDPEPNFRHPQVEGRTSYRCRSSSLY